MGDKSFVKVEKMAGYSLMNKMPKADEIVIKAGSVLTYSSVLSASGAVRVRDVMFNWTVTSM